MSAKPKRPPKRPAASAQAASAEIVGPQRAAEPSKSKDVAVVYGASADGSQLGVIRKRADRIETGVVSPLREGRPIHGEVVRLKPRRNTPLVFDVESEFELPAPTAKTQPPARTGPAQVATDDYRKNWDQIWKRPKKPALLN